MIMRIISRYRPRYVRSLVYMLQASEYEVGDYLHWLNRVKNFSKVENRKQIKKSPKALLLLGTGWAVWLAILAISLFSIFIEKDVIGYVAGTLGIIASPYILAYVLASITVVIQIAQKPIEAVIIKQAKKKISKHQGLKIAIAGSYGKTTMREILKTVISEGKKVAAPPNNFNTPLSISRFIKNLEGDEDVLIFELGEYYPGDVRKLCKIVKPDMGVITGINEAHLYKFKTLESTVKTIFELADYLGGKPVYVNGESALARKASYKNHIIYTRENADEWEVNNPTTSLEGTSFTLLKDSQKINLKSNLLGLHQIGPIALSAVVALKLGLTQKQIKAGVSKTKPFDHRLEPKKNADGVITLDDSYNGNPAGVKAVIDFLAILKGRRFYVTPGLVEMGNKTKEVHVEIGKELANSGIERVVLIKNSVTPYIAEGLRNGHYKGEVIWFNEALEAYAAIPHMTVQGDIVLLQNDWPDQYE